MLSQYHVALIHLVNHAFFKALLFLAAGAIIHGIADQQDLRRLGGLVGFIPFTYTAILIGSISLIALPWLTGFYSKDLLLELAYGRYTTTGTVAYWLGCFAAASTAFYSFRLISLAFFNIPSAPREDYHNAQDAPILIIVPLIILSILAITYGYIAKDLYVGQNTDFLSTALFQLPSNVAIIESEYALPINIKLVPLIVSIGGACLAVFVYHIIPKSIINIVYNKIGRIIYRFLVGKWMFDAIVGSFVIKPFLIIGHTISKILDRGVIEIVGPYGISRVLNDTAYNITQYDTGIVTTYALYIVLGIISLILYVFSPVVLINLNTEIDYSLILVIIITLAIIPKIRTVKELII